MFGKSLEEKKDFCPQRWDVRPQSWDFCPQFWNFCPQLWDLHPQASEKSFGIFARIFTPASTDSI